MTYTAKLKVHFDTEWTTSYGGSRLYDDEILPEEHYTFEIPCHDINSTQLFRFFATIARAMGHHDLNIMKGACSLAFNDMNSQEDMKKVADEYDLIMSEDLSEKIKEAVKLEKERDTEWQSISQGLDSYYKTRLQLLQQRLVDEHEFTKEAVDNLLE